MDNPELRAVPLIIYTSPSLGQPQKLEALRTHLHTPVSHDVIFHSLLSIAGIRADVYRPELDVFNARLRPHVDPFLVLEAGKSDVSGRIHAAD